MKKIPALFYKNSNDKKPVRDWLLELSEDDRKIIGQDIATVEYAYPVGMPTCRSLGSKLEEVRSDFFYKVWLYNFVTWIYKKNAKNTKK